MHPYTKEQREDALRVVSSTIRNCESIQPKFAVGTSQHTLLRNRIKALYISQSLLSGEKGAASYTKEELMEALPPISSIISKSEKAQLRLGEGSPSHSRFQSIITAMQLARALLTEEIRKRE